MSIEFVVEKFNLEIAIETWNTISKLATKDSDLNIFLNHESAHITVYKNNSDIIHIYAFFDCMEWSNLADSNVSNDEYERKMNKFIESTFDYFKSTQPNEFKNTQYTSTWYGDYSYLV